MKKIKINCIGGIMIVELASNVVDHEFDSRSDQTKDNKIDIRVLRMLVFMFL